MANKWLYVREAAQLFDVDAHLIIAEAEANGVSAERVNAAITRTLMWTMHNPTASPQFTDFDAVPPGRFDMRVLLQDRVWVDILRRRRNLVDMEDAELAVVTELLYANADLIHRTIGEGNDARAWLSETRLLRRIRTIQETGRVPPPRDADQ